MKKINALIVIVIMIALMGAGCSSHGGSKGKPLNADAGPDRTFYFVKGEKEQVTVEFDASNSTGNIQNYAWDFDRTGAFHPDATGRAVNHTYKESGRYLVSLRVDDGKEEDFDTTYVYVNYQEHENSSLGDGDSEEYTFPVKMPATRVYGEIRYEPGNIVKHNLTLRFTDAEGNSTDRDGTDKGEREEGGKVVKWVEIKGNFVLQYKMGDWKAHVERHDSAGGSVDYSLFIEVDYNPEAAK